MQKLSRRQMLATTCAAGIAAAEPGELMAGNKEPALQPLVHMVYFWLKRPESTEDREALIAGLQTLRQIPVIQTLYIGVPASTEKRDVVDNSFQVSELMFFPDVEAQKRYQDHPVHQAFVKNCEHLWQRVVVYDSMAVE